jgi:hypothetical protein
MPATLLDNRPTGNISLGSKINPKTKPVGPFGHNLATYWDNSPRVTGLEIPKGSLYLYKPRGGQTIRIYVESQSEGQYVAYVFTSQSRREIARGSSREDVAHTALAEQLWDELFARPESEKLLQELAEEIRADIKGGRAEPLNLD